MTSRAVPPGWAPEKGTESPHSLSDTGIPGSQGPRSPLRINPFTQGFPTNHSCVPSPTHPLRARVANKLYAASIFLESRSNSRCIRITWGAVRPDCRVSPQIPASVGLSGAWISVRVPVPVPRLYPDELNQALMYGHQYCLKLLG